MPEVSLTFSGGTFGFQRPSNADPMRGAYAGGATATGAYQPTIITSDDWLRQRRNSSDYVGKGIALHGGIKTGSWSIPLRAADEDIKTGKARYSQERVNGTRFDLQSVAFTFQGGNILPVYQGFVAQGENLNVRANDLTPVIPIAGAKIVPAPQDLPPGLYDFYLFLQLINQPPRLNARFDGDPDTGKPNYVWIQYSSLKFPRLLLKGYFTPEGLSVEDDVDDMFNLTWTATFIVHEMTPSWSGDRFSEEMVKVYKERIGIRSGETSTPATTGRFRVTR
jgi:hypothetical protein